MEKVKKENDNVSNSKSNSKSVMFSPPPKNTRSRNMKSEGNKDKKDKKLRKATLPHLDHQKEYLK